MPILPQPHIYITRIHEEITAFVFRIIFNCIHTPYFRGWKSTEIYDSLYILISRLKWVLYTTPLERC